MKSRIDKINANLAGCDNEFSKNLEKRLSHLRDAAKLARAGSGNENGLVKILLSEDHGAVSADEYVSGIRTAYAECNSYLKEYSEKTADTFNKMAFAKYLTEDEKYGLDEIAGFIFDRNHTLQHSAEKKTVLMRNAFAGKAFERFASGIRGLEATYDDSFKNLCEAVAEGYAEYAVMPVWSSTDGRLDGPYGLLEKYGLVIRKICTVSSDSDDVTRFALIGRPGTEPFVGGRKYMEIRIAMESLKDIGKITDAAEFFGVEIDLACSLPERSGNASSFSFVFDITDADFEGMLTYVSLEFPRFVMLGIYQKAGEK